MDREEDYIDRIFDDPDPPAPAIITEEVFLEDVPVSDNPGSLVQKYLQQNYLGKAIRVYTDGLSAGKFSERKQSADKIVDLSLGDKAGGPSGVNINFSFGGKFNERPEVEVGREIDTGEETRFGKG